MIQFDTTAPAGHPSAELINVVRVLHFLMNEEHGRWVTLTELRDLHTELEGLKILPVVETVTVEQAMATLADLRGEVSCCLVAFVIHGETSMPPRYSLPNSTLGGLFLECVPNDRVVVVGVTVNNASEPEPIGLTGLYRVFTVA